LALHGRDYGGGVEVEQEFRELIRMLRFDAEWFEGESFTTFSAASFAHPAATFVPPSSTNAPIFRFRTSLKVKVTELRNIHTRRIEGRQLDRPDRKPLESLGALRRASDASGKIR
jgi:hypothetical protein